MKANKQNRSVSLLLVCVMIIPILNLLIGVSSIDEELISQPPLPIELKNPSPSNFWELDEITISGNGGWAIAAGNDWCNGTGSWVDPYIIENVTFTVNDNKDYGLWIDSSTVYFIIRNCTFESGSTSGDAGLLMLGVNNGRILDNNISYNDEMGMYLMSITNNTFSGNNITNNAKSGVYLTSSTDNRFLNNNRSNNQFGFCIFMTCTDNVISNNIINSNSYNGIDIIDSWIKKSN